VRRLRFILGDRRPADPGPRGEHQGHVRASGMGARDYACELYAEGMHWRNCVNE